MKSKFGPFKIIVAGGSRAGKSTIQGIIARALTTVGGEVTCFDTGSGAAASAKVCPRPLPRKWERRPFRAKIDTQQS